MAKGKRRKQAQQAPFTMVYATWPRLLHEAGVSGVEWAVLVALAQHPQRNGYLSRPVADYGAAQEGIATATGCSERQVCNALEALTRKTFTTADGKATTILTRKASGHRGRCAVYKCNLPKWPDHKTDHHENEPEPKSDTDGITNTSSVESITNPLPNEDGKDNQSVPSCITNPLHHLEKMGGAGKNQPPPPWLR